MFDPRVSSLKSIFRELPAVYLFIRHFLAFAGWPRFLRAYESWTAGLCTQCQAGLLHAKGSALLGLHLPAYDGHPSRWRGWYYSRWHIITPGYEHIEFFWFYAVDGVSANWSFCTWLFFITRPVEPVIAVPQAPFCATSNLHLLVSPFWSFSTYRSVRTSCKLVSTRFVQPSMNSDTRWEAHVWLLTSRFPSSSSSDWSKPFHYEQ